MLIVDNLSVNYGYGQVISKMDFTFEYNSIYGIVGENGVGKSTLLKAITNIIKYEGKIYSSIEKNYLSSLSYVPSEIFFYPKMKGIEYINFFLAAKNLKKINIEQWNEKFQLPLNNYISTYSTGMQKKLALMATLMLNDSILLLDEPFNALDTKALDITTEIISDMKEKSKNLIIITSHNLEFLSKLTSKIYILNRDSSLTLKKI